MKQIFVLLVILLLGGVSVYFLQERNVYAYLENICSEGGGQHFDCYKAHYQKLIKTYGVSTAFTDLKKRYEGNTFVRSQCHPLTHVLGNAAVEIYPTVSEAFTHGDSYCWSGYYHGVMEGFSAKIGNENIEREINTICADIPGKASYGFDYYNCVHGMGHGVMATHDDDLFESLEVCDALSGRYEQESCYGGVFMENIMVDNINHSSKYLKDDDLLYPCNAVADTYKGQCYLMQTSYMLTKNGGDFVSTFKLCSTVGVFAETCYQSLGRDASGRSVSDLTQTDATCKLGKNDNQRFNCLVGAVKDFVSYYHDDSKAKQLCALSGDDTERRCLSVVADYYQTFK